ncbi:MAG: PD40 domain-containing protein [Chloroflexi bacterium]|nr:PD40 domain-containing protein [Chloroflexota bacterium]
MNRSYGFWFLNRTKLFAYRLQLAALVLGALGAMAIVSCTGSTERDAQPGPTATFSPADATATWVAFKPELDRLAAESRERQIVQATITAAAAFAEEEANLAAAATPTVEAFITERDVIAGTGSELTPTPAATPAPLLPPARAIATGEVDRIAFSDGRGSVHTVNPDGADLATVASGSLLAGQFHYTFPVWSPDGGSLVFSSFLIVANSVVQSALHRADADGNGAIITLAVDDTSQSGVGPGVPHFSSWSPDGERIALTTSGEFGIGTILLGSYSGEAPKGIALGAPLYVNWAPDGTAILVHQAEGLHLIPVTGSGSGAPVAIGNGSISFNSPSWSPDSQSFAYVDSFGGKTSVVLTQKSDLDNYEVIADADVRVGLGWSPDGKHLAIARSSGTAFHTLSIYSPADSSERTVYEGDIRAFWWSPDSSRLAIVEDSPVIDLAHMWSVLDVESGEAIPLVTQVLSDEFLFVQVFFDQYAESHHIWAPDSSRLVITGTLLDVDRVVLPGGAADLPETFDSQVWVLDAAGVEEPVSIGRGTIASWSPR